MRPRCTETSLRQCQSPFPGTGILGAETAVSKRPVTFDRSSVETKPLHENPPIRLYLHDTEKSLFVWDCMVGLGGLEIPTKRLSATSPAHRATAPSTMQRVSRTQQSAQDLSRPALRKVAVMSAITHCLTSSNSWNPANRPRGLRRLISNRRCSDARFAIFRTAPAARRSHNDAPLRQRSRCPLGQIEQVC